MEAVLSQHLARLHVHVKEDWLSSAVRCTESNSSQQNVEVLLPMLFELFLYSDLTDSYVPQMSIPSAAMKLCIVKPMFFQIVGCIDTSASIYQQYQDQTQSEDNLHWFHGDPDDEAPVEGSSHCKNRKRLFKLKLSNGKQIVHAIEYGKFSHSENEMLPGSKILLTGRVLCRRGILLLNDHNCQLLGGEVDTLFSSFDGLTSKTKAMGLQTEKRRCVPAKPLPRTLLQNKELNCSTLSPFLVRIPAHGRANGLGTEDRDDDFEPELIRDDVSALKPFERSSNAYCKPYTQGRENDTFLAPTVVHTGAPVGFINPQPIRQFPKVNAAAIQSKPVVRVTANHRLPMNSTQTQPKVASINPLIARLCGSSAKSEDNVSSQLKELHRLSSQRVPAPTNPLPMMVPSSLQSSTNDKSTAVNSVQRRITSVSDAFSSLADKSVIIKEEVPTQLVQGDAHNCTSNNVDIPVRLHNKILPHATRRIANVPKKRTSRAKQDPTQRSISSYFNVMQPRSQTPAKSIRTEEPSTNAEFKKDPESDEVRVITLSQMGSEDDEDEEHALNDQSFTVNVIVPNGNQRRQQISQPSSSISMKQTTNVFPSRPTASCQANSHEAIVENMIVPDFSSPFRTPYSGNKGDDDDNVNFLTTLERSKFFCDEVATIRSSKEAVQRTHFPPNNEDHDPIKKKRTNYFGDNGRLLDELSLAPSSERNAFDVTLPSQAAFMSPKAEMVSGRSIIEKFNALNVMFLADVMRRKSFWMLPRMINIQGICKVISELKTHSGGWKLNVKISDSSINNVPCDVSPQLLEKMLGFNVESCKSLTMSIDSMEIARRKGRANLVMKALQRLDLLLNIEFSPETQVVPIVLEVSTLSEALHIS